MNWAEVRATLVVCMLSMVFTCVAFMMSSS